MRVRVAHKKKIKNKTKTTTKNQQKTGTQQAASRRLSFHSLDRRLFFHSYPVYDSSNTTVTAAPPPLHHLPLEATGCLPLALPHLISHTHTHTSPPPSLQSTKVQQHRSLSAFCFSPPFGKLPQHTKKKKIINNNTARFLIIRPLLRKLLQHQSGCHFLVVGPSTLASLATFSIKHRALVQHSVSPP